MASTLLFLHFVGLMVGATGGFASGLLMRRALSLPEAEALGDAVARQLRQQGAH